MVAVRFPRLGFLGTTRPHQIRRWRRTHGCGHPRGQGTVFAGHAYCALGIYLFSLVLPCVHHNSRLFPVFGLVAFVHALDSLVRCSMSPANALTGDWLLGLSWLANPAAWCGMVFLLTGRTRWAAWAGELSLLLATCALHPPLMVCQQVWLASMVYVLYAALCVPGDVLVTNWNPARPTRTKLCGVFYPAVALPVLFGLFLFLIDQRGHIKSAPLSSQFDPNVRVRTEEDAKLGILGSTERTPCPGANRPALPVSASNFWLYKDDSRKRCRTFWVFNCGSSEDCLKAVESLGGPRRNDLAPWRPSRYKVIMEGPAFYVTKDDKKLRVNPWDVPGIKNGLVYEEVISNTHLSYYAIDLDQRRVYHVSESGDTSDEQVRGTPGQ